MYYLGRMFPERKQDAVEQPPAKFFGVSLETGVAQSGGAEGGALVPLPVTQMIQYLEANGGLQREGLFRVGGNKTERKELMECWKRGQQNMPSDVDGAADLLKHYFLELPESLIPESHYLGTVHCCLCICLCAFVCLFVCAVCFCGLFVGGHSKYRRFRECWERSDLERRQEARVPEPGLFLPCAGHPICCDQPM